MLKIGGYINIVIAFGHLIGLFWAEQMFERTGVTKEMAKLTQIHFSYPYLLTFFVAIIFFVFGIYGLSASGKIRKLPYLKLGVFTIALIYLFRGIGEQSYNIIKGTTTQLETTQSIIALIIGLLFLFGGLQKWKLKKEN
ncbi:hypothetical protein [uncultured Tenacibaculum sp.]|uniref:hypothetical protein n=1 Tax=uncultured Tenacibaculum sp. TaxID=174713 RepID=UPI0026176977|nr:hypothetical protein [uncultured Tenacibaculum sp.]